MTSRLSLAPALAISVWTVDRAREEADAIGLRDPQLTAVATTHINTHR